MIWFLDSWKFWLSHKNFGLGFPLCLSLHFNILGRNCSLALAMLSELNFCSWYSVSSCYWPTQFPRMGRWLGQVLLPDHICRALWCRQLPLGLTVVPCHRVLSRSCMGLLSVLWIKIHAQFCFMAFYWLFSMSRAAWSPTLTPTLSYCFVIFRCLFKCHFLKKLFPDSLYNLGPRASYRFPS